MEHLDLAGVITTPLSNWHLPAFEATPFEQQDAIYLSSSRPMLEPIIEETSEDEESTHNSWTQYENNSVWSSESDTGSVIRIELNKDPDSISERDFACPAKRPRRDEFIIGGLLTCQPILDDTQLLRKYQRNDLLSSAIDKINSNETNSLTNSLNGNGGHRKRFDEFYCDMDSPSCNSLSRSSSLIQFESLERQLLNEQGLCSSLGNSSPSLLSIESGSGSGSNSNRGSTGCLKRYESSDSRLHQTYFDLDKIDFETNLHFTSTAASKSDSESSSDNSVASHKILSARGAAHTRGFLKGSKSSAENLSEDSGYCEHIHSVMRAKSKSIPNFEKFCEEDEFYDHPVAVSAVANSNELRKSHSKIQTTTLLEDAPKIATTKVNSNGNVKEHQHDDDADDDDDDEEEDEELIDEDDEASGIGDCWYTGDINSHRSPSSSSPISSDETVSSTSATTNTSKSTSPSSCASASSFTWRPAVSVISPPPAMATSKERTMAEATSAPLHRSSNRSSSLPDIRGEETAAVGHNHQQEEPFDRHTFNKSGEFQSKSTERVASVPNDLDRIEDHHHNHLNQASNSNQHHQHRQRRSAAQRRQPQLQRTLSASSSSDIDEDQSPRSPPSSSSSVVVRSNSWKRSRNSNDRLDSSAFQSARSLQSIGSGSGSGVGYMNASYSNLTLLDYSGRSRSNRNSLCSVSEEFNSKRSSRGDMATLISDQESDSNICGEPSRQPEEIHHVQLTIRKPPRRTNSKSSKSGSRTFDQDPTSLKTSYAESLEKCNFDAKELSNTDLTRVPPSKRRFHTANKKQRVGIVSSTPNLNAYSHEDTDDDLCVSSTHTSMQQLPITEKRMGILLPSGSRASFGSKGVSFYPVVSKYTWQEQSSEECNDTLVAPPADSNDNDATVIDDNEENKENTSKENTIDISQENICKEEAQNIEKTSHSDEENAIKEKITITINSLVAAAAKPPPVPAHNSIKSSIVERGSDCYRLSGNNVKTSSTPTSPRLILTASNKLIAERLDNPRPATPVPHILVQQPSGSVDSVSVTSLSSKMSNYPVKCSAASGESNSLNNNNELMKSKFKADEKHPQHKGFLSRFANGFRFSLRRNKKKQQQKEAGQIPPIATPSSKKPVHQNKNSPDFIYIPLKGPIPAQSNGTPCNNGKSSPTLSNSSSSNHVLLPNNKQTSAPFQKPPRVVGVCEKRASQHALQNAGPQSQSIDEEFLNNERSYYDFKNQLNGGTNGYGSNTQQNGPAMKNSNSHHIGAAMAPGGVYHYQPPQQQQQQQQLNHCKIGLIETNLDTHETKISGKTRSLMELGPQVKYNFSSSTKRNTSTSSSGGYDNVDNDEDVDEDGEDSGVMGGGGGGGVNISGGVMSGGHGAAAARRPHKSMEFLLDKENQKNVLPPENELQKSHDNTTRLSEHQLRVQASLQRLNIPDWFRQYNLSSPKSPSDGLGNKSGISSNFTRKRASDSGRWTGLNSKTTSLSSLGSQRSDRSPLLLSPSAHSHHGGQTTLSSAVSSTTAGATNVSGGFSRWSTSYLNSTQTSPSVSTRGSFSRGGPINSSFISATNSAGATRSSFRQPYLGWRSQEKLSQPRTPHERLASSLLAQRSSKEQPVTPEIQTSIKEVTSAIVHYVNDQTNRTNQRSRSASPNSRKCWLESSFVGVRPVESPQTPIIENSTFSNASTGILNHSFHNNTTSATSSIHSSIGINNVTTVDGLRINGVGGESAILI